MVNAIKTIKPPFGGISRNTAPQDTPPFTCYDSLNFWPIDVVDGHAASATRPPLVAMASPGAPGNLLGQLNLPSPTLYAAANGGLYVYNSGSWNHITSTVGITGGRAVQCVPNVFDLFILNDGAPAVYQSQTNSLVTWTATTGIGVPQDCRVGASYEGAVWLAGKPAAPHELFASRVGNPYDWDATLDDTGAALDAAAQSFGLLTEPITALIALRGRMIIACEDIMFVMTGHPRQGGRVDLLSPSSGILGPNAWCHVTTGRDELYFMTKTGLHFCQTQATITDLVTTPVSGTKIPNELIGLSFDASDPKICLEYCKAWNGIVITIRGSNPQAWWYDLTNNGFHRMSFSDYPFVLKNFDPFISDDTSGVVFAGPGYGGIAHFDRTGSEAMSEAFQIIGPFPLSDTITRAAKVQRIDHIIGAHTTDLAATIDFHLGRTAQIALLRARANSAFRKFSKTISTLVSTRAVTWPQFNGYAGTITIRQPQLTTARVVYEGSELALITDQANNDAGLLSPIVSPPSIPLPIGVAKD